MSGDDFAILAVAAICDLAWAVSLWKHWPEVVYQRKKNSMLTWYWLSVFRIERTEQNCVRFMRGCCIAGMILVTTFSILSVVFRQR
jgi:hypothetical protein